MAEKLEELQLPRAQVEIESRGAIYAVPFFEDPDPGKPSQTPEDTLGPGAWHPPLATSVSSGHPTSASPFPTALATPEAGVPLRCGATLGSPSPAEEKGGTGTLRHALSRAGRSSSCCGWCQGWDRESSHRMEVPGEVRGTWGCLGHPSCPHPSRGGMGHQCRGVGLCSDMGTSVCPSERVQRAGSVLEQGLAAQGAGGVSWQLEGREVQQ